jgi:hypothetical protein
MSKRLLFTLYLFFSSFFYTKAQDTLSFTGYLATNFYYLTAIDIPEGYSAGPDGPYQGIPMDDSISNLIGIGSFLVSDIPKRLVKLKAEYYVPEERTNIDTGNVSYDINARLLRDASLKTVLETTFRAWKSGKEYIIHFSFKRVRLQYVVIGSKEFRILTEKGLRTKTYKLVRLIKIDQSSK